MTANYRTGQKSAVRTMRSRTRPGWVYVLACGAAPRLSRSMLRQGWGIEPAEELSGFIGRESGQEFTGLLTGERVRESADEPGPEPGDESGRELVR